LGTAALRRQGARDEMTTAGLIACALGSGRRRRITG
jgi:hypothetical protein